VTSDRFSPGPPVSSTNKTDHYDILEILLKVALNTIKQTHINLLYNTVVRKDVYTFALQYLSLSGNTMGVTSGARSVNPSGAPEFILSFSVVRVARSVMFGVVFCRSLFVLVPLAIVLSVLRLFTAFDYPFVILKHF